MLEVGMLNTDNVEESNWGTAALVIGENFREARITQVNLWTLFFVFHSLC